MNSPRFFFPIKWKYEEEYPRCSRTEIYLINFNKFFKKPPHFVLFLRAVTCFHDKKNWTEITDQ